MLFALCETGINESTGRNPGRRRARLYPAAVGRDAGAQVIAIDGIPERIELARRVGTHKVVDMRAYASTQERLDPLAQLTDGSADLVLELTGVLAAFGAAVHFARPGGTVHRDRQRQRGSRV